MSSFPGGGGRAYVIDLDAVVKSSSSSPATLARSTHSSSSSPSATLSESRSHPLAISTKRARAPRKRPNQTYDEAAALLATAYPSVFSAKGLLDLCKKNGSLFYADPTAELLPPCPVLADAGFLLQEYVPSEQRFLLESTRPTSSSERSWACPSPASTELQEPNSPAESGDGFDADTIILDGQVGEGIDSIMGNLDMNANSPSSGNEAGPSLWNPTAYGHGGCGTNMRRALRRGAEDGEWWRCRTVEVLNINPELNPVPPHPGPPSTSKKKKKKKEKKKVTKVEKAEKDKLELGLAASSSPTLLQRAAADNKARLGLRLDYEEVLKVWSGRGSPFSDAGDSSEFPADAIVMLSQVELFLDEEVVAAVAMVASGGVREESMMRYK